MEGRRHHKPTKVHCRPISNDDPINYLVSIDLNMWNSKKKYQTKSWQLKEL